MSSFEIRLKGRLEKFRENPDRLIDAYLPYITREELELYPPSLDRRNRLELSLYQFLLIQASQYKNKKYYPLPATFSSYLRDEKGLEDSRDHQDYIKERIAQISPLEVEEFEVSFRKSTFTKSSQSQPNLDEINQKQDQNDRGIEKNLLELKIS